MSVSVVVSVVSLVESRIMDLIVVNTTVDVVGKGLLVGLLGVVCILD